MLKVATKFTPEVRAFETATAAGFRFAEFWLDAGWLNRWQTVAARAQQYPLEYALHFPNHGDLDEAALQAVVRLYHELGCAAMVIHTPMLRRYGNRLLQCDRSVRLGVENHQLDPTEFEHWAVDNVWLTLDVEHLWKYTLKDAPVDALIAAVRDFLRRFGDKLVHVHLPGYFPGCDEHRPMYCSRDMVLAVLSMLADYQFDGLVVSEVDSTFQNTHELAMDVLLYERWQELRAEENTSSVTNPRVA